MGNIVLYQCSLRKLSPNVLCNNTIILHSKENAMRNVDRTSLESPSVEDGRYMRALVVNRIDPRMEGRVAVLIPRLMPMEDSNLAKRTEKTSAIDTSSIQNTELKGAVSATVQTSNSLWARPICNGTGNFRVPYVGKTIYVFMEDGDPSKLYYTFSNPTLSGEKIGLDAIRSTADVFTPDTLPNLHVLEEFLDGTTIYYNENSDTRELELRFSNNFRISMADHPTSQQIELLTDSGHTAVLDQLNKHIYIRTADGHLVDIHDAEERISITSTGGHSVHIHDAEQRISIASTGGHTMNMDDAGKTVNINTSGGHTMNMNDGGGVIDINCSSGGTIRMDNGVHLN